MPYPSVLNRHLKLTGQQSISVALDVSIAEYVWAFFPKDLPNGTDLNSETAVSDETRCYTIDHRSTIKVPGLITLRFDRYTVDNPGLDIKEPYGVLTIEGDFSEWLHFNRWKHPVPRARKHEPEFNYVLGNMRDFYIDALKALLELVQVDSTYDNSRNRERVFSNLKFALLDNKAMIQQLTVIAPDNLPLTFRWHQLEKCLPDNTVFSLYQHVASKPK